MVCVCLLLPLMCVKIFWVYQLSHLKVLLRNDFCQSSLANGWTVACCQCQSYCHYWDLSFLLCWWSYSSVWIWISSFVWNHVYENGCILWSNDRCCARYRQARNYLQHWTCLLNKTYTIKPRTSSMSHRRSFDYCAVKMSIMPQRIPPIYSTNVASSSGAWPKALHFDVILTTGSE